MAYSVQDLKEILDVDTFNQLEMAQNTGIYTPRVVSSSYQIIPIPPDTTSEVARTIHRLNGLGSLFYFATVILKKTKFQRNPNLHKNLHYQMCKVVEKDGLQEVIEIPRDHYKSSVYSECLPMWRTLPFLNSDEYLLRTLGYGDAFILWMRRAHRQDFRWLLCSEVTKNAAKLGKRIANHYESNKLFQHVYPEIIPDSSTTWNNLSLFHKRTEAGKGQGEGTYDFIGVGSALQSTHYDGSIQDDLIGRAAFESPSVLEDTIEYHKLLVGALDQEVDHDNKTGLAQRENDEVVVGNRWAYNDLNSYIREHEDYFNFTTHSALGGCCPVHPYGVPIFPEAFSIQKLEKYKKRLGNYLFSCQFLNVPINPSEVKFHKKDLRYYELVRDDSGTLSDKPTRVKIRHHVHDGDVIEDIYPRNLARYMTIDPNHSGNDGRCRHAIAITGVHENPRREYLLDVWAEATSIDIFIHTIFTMAFQWKITQIHLETIAAQKYLKYHLDHVTKTDAAYKILLRTDKKGSRVYIPGDFVKSIRFIELKTPKTKNAKQLRIDAFGPVVQRNEFWVNTHGQSEFMEEYETYPLGKLRDVLDVIGYALQVWDFDEDSEDIEDEILKRKQRYIRDTTVNKFA